MSDDKSQTDGFETEILDVAYGGDGVARRDGKVLFIPGVIEGERIRARIVESRKRFDIAVCESVVAVSPQRILPQCPLALMPGINPRNDACCGCSYQHMSYFHELEVKKKQLASLLAKIGGIPSLPDIQIVPSPGQFNYRNKISLHVGRVDGRKHLGYVARDNRSVIEVGNCPIAAEALNKHLSQISSSHADLGGLKDRDIVFLRFSQECGVLEWVGAGNAPDTNIVEKTCIGDILVPAGSFFQVSLFSSEMLFSLVLGMLTDIRPKKLIDFYCGSGIFALCGAHAGVEVSVGVESDTRAVECARLNAEKMKLSAKTRFIADFAENAAGQLLDEGHGDATLAVLDPPRLGLGRRLIEALVENPPGKILYISCGADTLSRDAKILCAGGYEVESLSLCDLFPRTSHFETIALFSR
jgi:23S rRNA (uracil1939-C5)-methyltransferase